eukprot:232305-Chlamydomonas_euryale.AAC.1
MQRCEAMCVCALHRAAGIQSLHPGARPSCDDSQRALVCRQRRACFTRRGGCCWDRQRQAPRGRGLHDWRLGGRVAVGGRRPCFKGLGGVL